MGRSTGVVPLRLLSTKTAARQNISQWLGLYPGQA